jgi:hypothetical protein
MSGRNLPLVDLLFLLQTTSMVVTVAEESSLLLLLLRFLLPTPRELVVGVVYENEFGDLV